MQHIGENTHWFSYLYQQEEFVEAVKKEYEKEFFNDGIVIKRGKKNFRKVFSK